jgi:hypothetical protein
MSMHSDAPETEFSVVVWLAKIPPFVCSPRVRRERYYMLHRGLVAGVVKSTSWASPERVCCTAEARRAFLYFNTLKTYNRDNQLVVNI